MEDVLGHVYVVLEIVPYFEYGHDYQYLRR